MMRRFWLQVLGNGKGVLATVASVLIFKNPVNIKSASGYGVAIAGVVAYAEVAPLLPSRPSADDPL